MRWWILACLIGCGSGLQSTSAECKDGYERDDDGSCYATDDAESDDDDGSPTGGDAGDVDERMQAHNLIGANHSRWQRRVRVIEFGQRDVLLRLEHTEFILEAVKICDAFESEQTPH